MRRRVRQCAAAALLLAAGAGCSRLLGPRYWDPPAEDRATAESVARLHVLQNLSDQAGQPDVMALAPDAEGRVDYPVVFTVGGAPFARYRHRMWGEVHEGVRTVVVAWFDPVRMPDEDPGADAEGEFPAYFTVRVDPAARRVVP